MFAARWRFRSTWNTSMQKEVENEQTIKYETLSIERILGEWPKYPRPCQQISQQKVNQLEKGWATGMNWWVANLFGILDLAHTIGHKYALESLVKEQTQALNGASPTKLMSTTDLAKDPHEVQSRGAICELKEHYVNRQLNRRTWLTSLIGIWRKIFCTFC